jgi:hypothetical protein
MVKISRHHSPALSHELDFLKLVRNLDNASQMYVYFTSFDIDKLSISYSLDPSHTISENSSSRIDSRQCLKSAVSRSANIFRTPAGNRYL